MIDKLYQMHKQSVLNFMYKFNLDEYHIAWIGWIKGLVVGLVLGIWLF